ncbi:MAG: hypothetical protein U0838_06375 [Chloroflexota bacterium]
MTNPPASAHPDSLSADDDGGYLRDRISAYYAGTPLSLGAAGPGLPVSLVLGIAVAVLILLGLALAQQVRHRTRRPRPSP